MPYKVIGIKKPDDTWSKMKNVWESCIAAKVSIPDQVIAFFNNKPPNYDGIEVQLDNFPSIVIEQPPELVKDRVCSVVVLDLKELMSHLDLRTISEIRFYFEHVYRS